MVGVVGTMLRDVYYNEIQGSDPRTGNWELSIVGIGVFLDDKAIYDRGISLYRARIPAFIYLTSDGALPKTVPSNNLNTREKIIGFWYGQSTFVNGLTRRPAATSSSPGTTQRRPLGTNNLFVSWETLTHGDNLGQNKKKGPSPDGPFSQVDDTGIEPVTPTVSR